ncbi:hypothetical protein ACIRPT_26080 [Streptomyces sp. NPDC101227]|uniref:hypothetical protein n=1 Tax=Streptomyces sp. NPDC101227 TaxID=3366136 RepID=UPI0037FB1824
MRWNTATQAALVANNGQRIGSWGAVGTAAQKAGTLSLGSPSAPPDGEPCVSHRTATEHQENRYGTR